MCIRDSNSTPTGAAKLNLQSLLSVDSFSNRQSVTTFPGKSSTSESVCRHRISSPTRISSGYSPMSFRQVVSEMCIRDRHKGGHDVATHDDFIHYILHIHYYIAVS